MQNATATVITCLKSSACIMAVLKSFILTFVHAFIDFKIFCLTYKKGPVGPWASYLHDLPYFHVLQSHFIVSFAYQFVIDMHFSLDTKRTVGGLL